MQKETQSSRKLDVWSRKARSQTPSVSVRGWVCAGKTELVVFSVVVEETHIPSRLVFKTAFTASVLPLMNNFALSHGDT